MPGANQYGPYGGGAGGKRKAASVREQRLAQAKSVEGFNSRANKQSEGREAFGSKTSKKKSGGTKGL